MSSKIYRHNPNTPEGKYGVMGRDGFFRKWPSFVLGANDPAAPAALQAYAEKARELEYTPDYADGVQSEGIDFAEWRITHSDSNPSVETDRLPDHPLAIALMRGDVRINQLWNLQDVRREVAISAPAVYSFTQYDEDYPEEEDEEVESEEPPLYVRAVAFLIVAFVVASVAFGLFGAIQNLNRHKPVAVSTIPATYGRHARWTIDPAVTPAPKATGSEPGRSAMIDQIHALSDQIDTLDAMQRADRDRDNARLDALERRDRDQPALTGPPALLNVPPGKFSVRINVSGERVR